MSNLRAWAVKWGVPIEAVLDLEKQFGMATDPATVPVGQSEAAVQAAVRLEASRKGARLFRNNRGACYDINGNFIRYGLGNDSDRIDKVCKSHDLIGIRPVLIGPEHIGQVIGQFLSREVKKPGWGYAGTPREAAQLKWAELIASLGGDASFATGEGTI